MDNKKAGKIMVLVGFMMILANALDYLFNWNYVSPAVGALGLIFVAIGMVKTKK